MPEPMMPEPMMPPSGIAVPHAGHGDAVAQRTAENAVGTSN